MKGKTCYIDCTDTFFSDLNTGIQRVVRSIVSRAPKSDGLRGYSFVPVIFFAGEFYPLKGRYALTRGGIKILGGIRNVLDRLFLKRNEREQLCTDQSLATSAESRKNGMVPALHAKVVLACRNVVPSLINLALLLDCFSVGSRKVRPRPGDVYFIADAFWNRNTLLAATSAKEAGMKVVLHLYDLIPITHPDFCDDGNVESFRMYLPQILSRIDAAISISNYTLVEFVDYCRRNAPTRQVKNDFYHLGADFSTSEVPECSNSGVSRDLLESEFLLMVGTIEPRKNHLFVLDALERLWEQGVSVNLCIVGKLGWKFEPVQKRIAESKFLNTRLFHYSSLDDFGLQCCFQKSMAVVMSSIVEGFGLPLVEAMHFRKAVLASDIPVFREVAGDYPHYFQLDDVNSLMDSIRLISAEGPNQPAAGKSWITWDESVANLLDRVTRMADELSAAS